MSPGKVKTRVCGYICSEFIHWALWRTLMGTEYFLFIHYTTRILVKFSTCCFEHSGDISSSLLVNLSHTDESLGGRNMCLWIYTLWIYSLSTLENTIFFVHSPHHKYFGKAQHLVLWALWWHQLFSTHWPEPHWWVLGRTKHVCWYIRSEFIHWAPWEHGWEQNIFCLLTTPQAFRQASARGDLSTLMTSVVLYSLTWATLMSPGIDKTRVCGYIHSGFIHWALWRTLVRTEYFLFVHYTASILAKLSTCSFEDSGDICCSLLVNPSHNDESWQRRNACL